jgi:hypothetical protein
MAARISAVNYGAAIENERLMTGQTKRAAEAALSLAIDVPTSESVSAGFP